MLWSKTHALTIIPSLIIYGIVGFFIGKPLKQKPDKIKLIPIYIITLFLVIFEIIKQILSIIDGYNLSNLPFHFCSLFLFLYPATSFYHGKFKDKIRLITILSCGLLLLGTCIFPNLIYSENALLNTFKDFGDFHTVIYHNLVLLGFFIMINLNLVEINNTKSNYIAIITFFTLYSLIITPIALLTKENFNNICYCQIPAIENIRINWNNTLRFFGQLLYDSIIIIGITAFACIIFFILTIINKLFKKLKNKI